MTPPGRRRHCRHEEAALIVCCYYCIPEIALPRLLRFHHSLLVFATVDDDGGYGRGEHDDSWGDARKKKKKKYLADKLPGTLSCGVSHRLLGNQLKNKLADTGRGNVYRSAMDSKEASNGQQLVHPRKMDKYGIKTIA